MWTKKRAPTRRTMPTWDGRDDTAIQHLNALETFFKEGQLLVWRDAGVSEAEIVRVAPLALAQITARFDAWRRETTAARVKLGAS